VTESASKSRDVVVVGSGAAGLAAALSAHDAGASVLLLEKAFHVGGTTALSGGVIWVPCNDHMAEVGIDDNRTDALRYIRQLTGGRDPDPSLIEVYVDAAAGVLRDLEANTPLRCVAPPRYSDYYADLPGGRRAGRSVEPVAFPGSALGSWSARVQKSPFLVQVTAAELIEHGSPISLEVLRLAMDRHVNDVRVRGSALVAALLRGVLDRSIDVVTEARAERLTIVGDEVVGVQFAEGDGRRCVDVRGGVVLASGGFEWSGAMTRAFLGHEVAPLTAPTNEGDGLRMAMQAGAQLANMTSYWGQPATVDPTLTAGGAPVLQFVPGRDRPGSIIVNRHGQRFVNEGIAYHDFVRAFSVFDPVTRRYPNEPPVWMVFDEAMRRSTPMLSIVPDRPAPAWLPSAGTIEALARTVGIDPDGLCATVARFNDNASHGVDPDFHRGTVWFEAFMTDGPRPESTLAPLTEPPFYAVEIRDGTIGTNGGPSIDGDGRVRSAYGGVVPGLYAAGNVSACVFGSGYPGGGATIGPALVFGSLAGRHAARRAREHRDVVVREPLR
jgi:succinate dehydrogenase/fumarate reductase flavoprotein subunit